MGGWDPVSLTRSRACWRYKPVDPLLTCKRFSSLNLHQRHLKDWLNSPPHFRFRRSGLEPKFAFWTGFLVVLIHCSGERSITGTGINIACVLMTFHWNWGSSQTGGWLEAENCWEIDPYWEVCCEEGSSLLSLIASTREARFACPGICLYLLILCILEIHYLVSGAGRTCNFCCEVG